MEVNKSAWPADRSKIRAVFETWAKNEGYDLKRDRGNSGPYSDNDTQFAWNGFRACYDFDWKES